MDTIEVSKARLIMAYKNWAMSEEGQIILADIVRHFGYPRGPMFDITKPCPYTVTFRDGQRSVAAYIGKMIDADPYAVEKEGQPIHDDVRDDEGPYDEDVEQLR